MNKLEELLAKLEATDKQIDALLVNDQLTEDQRAEHDLLQEDRKRTVSAINSEKNRLAREQERERLQGEAEETRRATAVATERRTRIETAGTGRLTDADLPHIGARYTDRIPAQVKRHRVHNFRGTRSGADAEERAYRFGMWLLAQATLSMPSRFRFREAVEFVDRQMTAVGTTDVSGYSNLVPEEFGMDLIDLREERGVARQILRRVPMASDTRTDPRRQGGLTAYPVAENSAGTESNKVWDNVRLTAKDWMVIARYSNQLRMDAAMSIGDDLAGEIAYAFADAEDLCCFNGDGTSTYARTYGIRARLLDIDGAGTDSAGLVTAAGNLYSEITLANFNTLLGKLPVYARTPRTCWVVSSAVYHDVMERLILAAGGVPGAEIINGTLSYRFLGFPVKFSQVMPSTEANTQVCVLLGDFSQGGAFGDRQADEISFSEEAVVGGQSLWERNQIGVRGIERFDINIHDVGSSSVTGPIVGLVTASS